jgi:hypothetical protein
MTSNKITINHEQVNLLFNSLWPDQDGGFLAVSTDGGRGNGLATKFFSHPLKEDLLLNALERWGNGNVWFSIGLFEKRPQQGRGRVSDVTGFPGLVADIDCQGGTHNEKNLPTREEALQFISEIPFKPSMIIWSGGGFQVYWLFDEPLIFEDAGDREKASGLSLKWQRFIVARGKEKGWKLDSVGSLEHLFRIPGMYNHKADPVPVEIIEKNDFRYSVESIESFLDDIPDEHPQSTNGSDLPGIGTVDTLHFSIKQLIENGAEKGKRSEAIGSVLAAMVRTGIPENDIISTFEENAIGEKYREKGSGRVKWLKDEINRMRAFVESKKNKSVNEKNESNELNAIENRIWEKWPVLDEKKALVGFAGRFVELASRKSEADPAAILMTFLMRFGVEVGAGPFLYVGDTKHYARSDAVIVGNSSKARKGTSEKPVKRLFNLGTVDELNFNPYVPATTSPGPLSSGEGLIWAVRDPVETYKIDKKTGEGETVVVDPGVDDKRLCVVDEEFGSALSANKREGNTLSTIIRCLWDSGDLEPLTKNNRTRTTGAHVGIISHITLAELNRKLEDTETFSGFANRFLWCCARRNGLQPFPEPMPADELSALQKELKSIVSRCQKFDRMELTEASKSMWVDLYTELSKDHSGLVGAVINRAEAQVLRLSMIYALLDSSMVIKPEHLGSALAVWQYCEDSARFIFSGREINPYAQKLSDLLMTHEQMTTKGIFDAFSRNITKQQLDEAVTELLAQNKITVEKHKTDGPGRPETIFKWAAASADKDGLDFTF